MRRQTPCYTFLWAKHTNRLSFESAMLNLGGTVIGFSSAENSSASKAKALLIQSVLYHAMPISVQCAIQRKVLQRLPPCFLASQSSMLETADTSIQLRRWLIFHNPYLKGTYRQHDNRSLRWFKIWPYRSFSDWISGSLWKCKICPYLLRSFAFQATSVTRY